MKPADKASFDFRIGKLPPQAVELEEAVIGAILLQKDCMAMVIEILKAESFYKEAHGIIFKAALKLHMRAEPIDLLTITNQLMMSGELELIGGGYYLSRLTNRVASAANIEFHSRIVAQKFLQREIIRIGTDAVQNAYDDTCSDVFNLLDSTISSFFSIEKTYTKGKKIETLQALLHLEATEYAAMEQAAKNKGVVGVDTGAVILNEITGGWREPDLVIIAARPAMGKTALALFHAKAAALSKVKTAIFSLEMSSLQLVKRLLQGESEVDSYGYRNASLSVVELQQLEIARGRLEDLGMFIDDTPALTILDFRSKARQLVQKHGVGLIVVDYLQLMKTGEDRKWGGNREQEISTISAGLKATAKELCVPILALSQLSRAVETRGGDKRPQLSDLRESGAIEQDADIVMFIHRPEYYGFYQDADGNSTKGIAELIISKHRNGPLGSVFLGFHSHLTKFYDRDSGRTESSDEASPNNVIGSTEENSD